ncbi:two-component system sensor histidine kinase [Aquipluma nitroreducens]|uniref:Two-component system sensor histidine kinase n=1 Tax=Aquipluma nitroreducens TaxID=2010828 RepID=A0A5K7S311_9BACT|nr:response regulator [Aquipluma nitroreducens]BBE15887.1 two-component system sensor histidine kinase [Aquipluma nitroreducens]
MEFSDTTYSWLGKTVLIVEDNETSNIYFEAALRKTKAVLIWARNGLDAVEIVKNKNQVDLILMDINMPKLDGIEATRIIKGINPEIVIVVQTAFILSGEERMCQEAGCDEFITKPIRLKYLLDTLNRYLASPKEI